MKHRLSIAQEVAGATNVLTNELEAKTLHPTRHNPTRSAWIVSEAKKLQRLQTKARKLRSQLTQIKKDIRDCKRTLRGIL